MKSLVTDCEEHNQYIAFLKASGKFGSASYIIRVFQIWATKYA